MCQILLSVASAIKFLHKRSLQSKQVLVLEGVKPDRTQSRSSHLRIRNYEQKRPFWCLFIEQVKLKEGPRYCKGWKGVQATSRTQIRDGRGFRPHPGPQRPPAAWRASPGPRGGLSHCARRSLGCASSSRSTACGGSGAQSFPPPTPPPVHPAAAQNKRIGSAHQLHHTDIGSLLQCEVSVGLLDLQ